MSTRFEPGVAPRGMIPLCVPEIRGNEWTYVKECLDTGWVSSAGAYVDRFEASFAQYLGRRRAIAVVNGTSALHVALLAVGVHANDEVVVSTLTFIAPANAIRYVGAWPVFVDAEPVYWQMDVAKLADFFAHGCRWTGGSLVNKTTGRRIGAIVPVHILGHPVDLKPLLELARRYELPVIEDATESLGGRYDEKPIGALGDVACFSFNGNKLLTTGAGGMIVTDNDAWAEKIRHLTTQAKLDPVEYIHDEVGYNYRLSNLQAAIGCAQLEQIEPYVEAKRRIAQRYSEALVDSPGLAPMREALGARSVFWMFTILVDPDQAGEDSRGLLRRLAAAQIQTRPLWQPLHLSPAHQGSMVVGGDVAVSIQDRALSLPCSVGLSAIDQMAVIAALANGRVAARAL